MKENSGRAAIVVPTGFLTAATGIPKRIREYIVKERMPVSYTHLDVYKRQNKGK